MEVKMFNELFKLFNGIFNILGDEVKQIFHNKVLEYQAELYNRNLFLKPIITSGKIINFQKIYISPKILDEGNNQTVLLSDPIKFINSNQFSLFIGQPGYGKSMLLRYFFINSVQKQWKIPIKIELRYLNEFDGNLIEYIKEKILFQEIAVSSSTMENVLSSGNFLFLFDGVDELGNKNQMGILKSIDLFSEKYSKNTFVITSRPNSNVSNLSIFKVFRMLPFDLNETLLFAEKYQQVLNFKNYEKLELSIRNFHQKEFLSNPLLLSLYLLVFHINSLIPKKASVFYKQVIDILFFEHDLSSKAGFLRELRSNLDRRQIEQIIEEFSMISYFEETIVFDINYLDIKIKQIRNRISGFDFEVHNLIYDLVSNLGILIEDGLKYTFPHKSIQEYFTTQYILTQNNREKKIKFYKKINEMLIINSGYYSNILSLLFELDSNNCINEIVLPLIKYYRDIIEEYSKSYSHRTSEASDLKIILTAIGKEKECDFYLLHAMNDWSYLDSAAMLVRDLFKLEQDLKANSN